MYPFFLLLAFSRRETASREFRATIPTGKRSVVALRSEGASASNDLSFRRGPRRRYHTAAARRQQLHPDDISMSDDIYDGGQSERTERDRERERERRDGGVREKGEGGGGYVGNGM